MAKLFGKIGNKVNTLEGRLAALFLFGCFFHLLTNLFWPFIPKKSFGEWLYFTGVSVVFPCLLMVATHYFKTRKTIVYYFSDFFFNLSIAQLFTQLFLNPFQYQPSELYNFAFAILILLYRIGVFDPIIHKLTPIIISLYNFIKGKFKKN